MVTQTPDVLRKQTQEEDDKDYCEALHKDYVSLASRIHFLIRQIRDLLNLLETADPAQRLRILDALYTLNIDLNKAEKDAKVILGDAEEAGCDTSSWPVLPADDPDR